MNILPQQTHLPSIPISHRHIPKPIRRRRGYREYHRCLRWDFGFTCAFCLLHEADIAPQGTDGLGVLTAEHFRPQSIERKLANTYTNLVYACRFCNAARKAIPNTASNRTLLDPTKAAWADHFKSEADHITPRDNDSDALYTHKIYNLDDERKIKRRKHRREVVGVYLLQFLEGQKKYQGYLEKAQAEQSPNKSLALLRKAKKIYDELLYPHYLFLQDYAAIPADAPRRCRCRTTEMHCLPEEFSKHLVLIDAP